jgi:hypothetical protein
MRSFTFNDQLLIGKIHLCNYLKKKQSETIRRFRIMAYIFAVGITTYVCQNC